jgi:hypothetical protein
MSTRKAEFINNLIGTQSFKAERPTGTLASELGLQETEFSAMILVEAASHEKIHEVRFAETCICYHTYSFILNFTYMLIYFKFAFAPALTDPHGSRVPQAVGGGVGAYHHPGGFAFLPRGVYHCYRQVEDPSIWFKIFYVY